MKIIEKYVFKSFIGAFLFCIVLLMVLGVIGDILGFLDDIFKKGIPLSSIFSFYLYLAPFAFVNMIPFASLLGSVYVFNTLSKNHEVTAFITSGLSLWKLMRPVLITTFVLCLITFIVNDKFVPGTMEKANRIRQQELAQKGGKKGQKIKDLAIYGEGGQIIYAKSFDEGAKTLYNVIIHKKGSLNAISEKVSARVVTWQENNTWMGEDVMIFRVDPEGNFTQDPQIYKKKEVDIGEIPKNFVDSQWNPQLMSYGQLKKYLKIFGVGASSSVRRLLVDLNYKLSFPFTALVTVMVGIPLSIETGRASALIGMARGIMVAMLYLPVMAICLALGKGGVLPPVLAAWMSNIIFACVGAYYVHRKS